MGFSIKATGKKILGKLRIKHGGVEVDLEVSKGKQPEAKK